MSDVASQSALFSFNANYLNSVYNQYISDPSSVDASWKEFFEANKSEIEDVLQDLRGPSWAQRDLSIPADVEDSKPKGKDKAAKANSKTNSKDYTLALYQRYAHFDVYLDPLKQAKRKPSLVDAVADKELDKVYRNDIGAEFSYTDPKESKWLHERLTQIQSTPINPARQKKALSDVTKAEMFESYLHTKFPGAKRFSLEGCESYIVCINEIIFHLGGIANEAILGMAHRGRLNTLVNIMGKPYRALFSEFMGVSSIPEDAPGSGDVKYHLGYANVVDANGDKVRISLTANPSHLESVNPIVLGRVRSKQDEQGDKTRQKVAGILTHGDAAVMGQGVVAETLNMAYTPGYTTGGTIHVVINNQIGFTAEAAESRSTEYATDVAKMINAPVFHVDAYNVDAVIKASQIATEYKTKFGKDVFLDLVSYRKYGHNEGDEPFFTQPVMYTAVRQMDTIHSRYSNSLISKGVIKASDYDDIKSGIKEELNAEFALASEYKPTEINWLKDKWKDVEYFESEADMCKPVETKIDSDTFDELADLISHLPECFNANPKIKRLFDTRLANAEDGTNLDWAFGELMAYASLMVSSHNVRITGEDARRGTFSHRQAVLTDQKDGKKYNIFSPIEGAKFEVHNSVLSEFAVLGFEYGYSMTNPNVLTLWEAQFGDFANGAVTIYDQYVSSSEDKWLRMSGLVSLLPHGYEGQGPEHSSARIERYLSYCAKSNLIVCNLTTPANIFHALRRQINAKYRKPLIIFTPKSLLRSPLAVSTKEDFTEGSFETIIGDNAKNPSKVIFTSGKVYYDLATKRAELEKNDDIAIIRVEQYYPFDASKMQSILKSYKNVKEYIWVQEEPKNMGAYHFIRDYLEEACGSRVKYVGRVPNASPSTGFMSVHQKEQQDLISKALS